MSNKKLIIFNLSLVLFLLLQSCQSEPQRNKHESISVNSQRIVNQEEYDSLNDDVKEQLNFKRTYMVDNIKMAKWKKKLIEKQKNERSRLLWRLRQG